VCSVCISSDGKKIVSSGYDKTIKMWNALTGYIIKSLVGHTDSVLSVCFSKDNKTIASGSGDKTIKIWDA
jgi:WD40 repeat protein